MMKRWRVTGGLCVVLCWLVAAGCGDDSPGTPNPDPGPGPDPAQPMPDFSLIDVNPNSVTSAQPVSPRDQLTKISAWYFGHAT